MNAGDGVSRCMPNIDVAILRGSWASSTTQTAAEPLVVRGRSRVADTSDARHAIVALRTDIHQDAPSEFVSQLYAVLLGKFGLYRSQRRLALAVGRPALAVLQYLITRLGRRVPRDELIELLWPDQDTAPTVHRLHVAVSKLRRVVDEPGAGESMVQCDGDSYSISANCVVLDCELFETYYHEGRIYEARQERRLAAAAFSAALRLYGGDFLSDQPYAAWTEQQRVHFAERRLDVLTFLCDEALRESDLPSVVEYAHQILDADNLREQAHRQLMRAYYRLGERACAVKQYFTCRRLLAVELGVAPSRETLALHEAICNDAELPMESPIPRQA